SFIVFSILRSSPISLLFPYTTLFRSHRLASFWADRLPFLVDKRYSGSDDVSNGNDGFVVRSRQSATSDVDALSISENAYEAIEGRDDEGAVREGESRTYPRILL